MENIKYLEKATNGGLLVLQKGGRGESGKEEKEGIS